LPKLEPVMERVTPVEGRVLGVAPLMTGAAYASPEGVNDDTCPKTVTVTREMAPDATGRLHRRPVSGVVSVQLVVAKSPAGTRMVTEV
jgi:hypothetical protein